MVETGFLKRVELFSSLTQDQLLSLVRVSKIRTARCNEVLFRQGERGDTLYLVLEGRAKAVLAGKDGRRVTLATFGEGEIVGEMAVLDPGEPRSATVVATKPSRLMALSGEEFFRVLRANPDMAIRLIRTLTARLRDTSKRLGGLIFLDAFQRVTRHLGVLSESEGRRLADGSTVIPRPTQTEMAAFIGASRETVNRVLRELENQGVIRLLRRTIILRGDEE